VGAAAHCILAGSAICAALCYCSIACPMPAWLITGQATAGVVCAHLYRLHVLVALRGAVIRQDVPLLFPACAQHYGMTKCVAATAV
jgi:hypothetical protein